MPYQPKLSNLANSCILSPRIARSYASSPWGLCAVTVLRNFPKRTIRNVSILLVKVWLLFFSIGRVYLCCPNLDPQPLWIPFDLYRITFPTFTSEFSLLPPLCNVRSFWFLRIWRGSGALLGSGGIPRWKYLIVKKSNYHANRLKLKLELWCIHKSHLHVPLAGEHWYMRRYRMESRNWSMDGLKIDLIELWPQRACEVQYTLYVMYHTSGLSMSTCGLLRKEN